MVAAVLVRTTSEKSVTQTFPVAHVSDDQRRTVLHRQVGRVNRVPPLVIENVQPAEYRLNGVDESPVESASASTNSLSNDIALGAQDDRPRGVKRQQRCVLLLEVAVRWDWSVVDHGDVPCLGLSQSPLDDDLALEGKLLYSLVVKHVG